MRDVVLDLGDLRDEILSIAVALSAPKSRLIV